MANKQRSAHTSDSISVPTQRRRMRVWHYRPRVWVTGLAAVCATAAAVAGAFAAVSLPLPFAPADQGKLPTGWRALTFPKIERHTVYSFIQEDGVWIAKAQADRSASGLTYALSADAKATPMLRWRWKAENVVSKGDVARKNGDDYAARIYVTFAYDSKRASVGQRIKYEAAKLIYGEYPPHAGLNYVWDNRAPVQTNVPNAYTDRVHMIVVDSGSERLNQWIAHERNIYDDYRASFKEDPPAISGIAIMTDTDNTGERAVAYYADIALTSAP